MGKERTLIVGDVHGCYEELQELLNKCSYSKAKDRLIFVGDMINKGPYSLKVLTWIKEEGCEAILGNHELGFLNYLKDPDPRYISFTRLKREMGEDVGSWQNWLESLPLYIEEDDFIVVHGGLVPGLEISKTSAPLLTQIRTWDGEGKNLSNEEDPPWYELYNGEKLVVYGHWAAQGLIVRENTIGLDSGCCWGGQLSLLHLETKEVFQVKAKKSYKTID